MCFTERKILVKYHKLLENAKKPKGFWGKKMISSMNEGHYELTGWALDHINFERHYRVLDVGCGGGLTVSRIADRKSTRLNSSHMPKSRMPSSA